ncbi:MAG: ATP-binding protein [Gammaproteobacteria bacterium]|nr:MAG: ATP-binding protein [Gammaproteobacteria bacterium]
MAIMATQLTLRYKLTTWTSIGLFTLLLVSLYFLSNATENSAQVGRFYSWLLLFNALGLIVLATLIGLRVARLIAEYRSRVAGSRLTVKLVLLLVAMAAAPVSLVYIVSVQFLQRGVDSWFDVRMENALNDALELSRVSYEGRLRELARLTRRMAGSLSESDAPSLDLVDMRVSSSASSLTLLDQNGTVIASSDVDPTAIVPDRPPELVLRQLRNGYPYLEMEPISTREFQFRVVMPVDVLGPTGRNYILQALYPVSEQFSTLAGNVESAYAAYNQLAYQREELKLSFILTLSLALGISILIATLTAIILARRVVAPVRQLVAGTEAVAAGNYEQQIPVSGHDEIAYLVRSFNAMSRRIADARQAQRLSHDQAEEERAWLEAVLATLSSGVLTLDHDNRIGSANAAADQILNAPLTQAVGRKLQELVQEYPHLNDFSRVLSKQLQTPGGWQEQLTMFGPRGRQVLILKGASLSTDLAKKREEHVMVIEDVTTLIQAQRDAAWGEVARRLAHEIKNPLTPIQLAAEHLRKRCLSRVDGEDAEILDRSTRTIVQQVEAMKEMVNAFSQYARTPELKPEPMDLGVLVSEVLDLYMESLSGLTIDTQIEANMPRVLADPGRMRQLLHNLFKNAIEAMEGADRRCLSISMQYVGEESSPAVELEVRDSGPGFSSGLIDGLFEPYVTSKPRGTGLGLAIVKRIVDEHGGAIYAANASNGGAIITVHFLPYRDERHESPGLVRVS